MNMTEKFYKLMKDNNLYYEIVDYAENMIAVEITWGDWKHDHLRLEWLVRENMPEVKYINSYTTEDDGSDCYSAIHRFYF